MTTVLIIDDDDELRRSFEKLLTGDGYRVQCAASAEAGLRIVDAACPDLVILDVRLPGMNGLEAFERIHAGHPKLPVIVMTAYSTTETAIRATQMGAYDYILKPFDVSAMLTTIGKAVAAGRVMARPVAMNRPPEMVDQDAIIGSSPAMQQIYKAVGRVAATDATVLVRGDSGSGKELVARAVYQHSRREHRPFLVINCVAIPETLLESELFGYEKGAFTGAAHRRIGKIEQANGGTIFLDEIGDMPLALQAKILRMLQERSIERLGGREPIGVDVRIIAATHRNLEQMIEEGRFREDLYYRLNVVTIRVPSLDQRREDIPALADYFLARHSAELKCGKRQLDGSALATLKELPWPGNVRELDNTLQKAVIFGRGPVIGRAEILTVIGETGGEGGGGPAEPDDDILRQWARTHVRHTHAKNLFEAAVERLSAVLIEEALVHSNGNRSQAARLLGISRQTLHTRIDKYRLRLGTCLIGPDDSRD